MSAHAFPVFSFSTKPTRCPIPRSGAPVESSIRIPRRGVYVNWLNAALQRGRTRVFAERSKGHVRGQMG